MVKQYYGIKYPFSDENNDEIYLDLDETYEDMIKSKILHVLFTPKGQRLRNPDFGTDLIKFIFNPSDEITLDSLKKQIKIDINKYVPNVNFTDISIYEDENNDNSRMVIVHYTITKGNKVEATSVAVKI